MSPHHASHLPETSISWPAMSAGAMAVLTMPCSCDYVQPMPVCLAGTVRRGLDAWDLWIAKMMMEYWLRKMSLWRKDENTLEDEEHNNPRREFIESKRGQAGCAGNTERPWMGARSAWWAIGWRWRDSSWVFRRMS
jgi:hypothetical protein